MMAMLRNTQSAPFSLSNCKASPPDPPPSWGEMLNFDRLIMLKRLCILGSTGSIGTQALEIVSLYPEKFRVIGLSAKSNLKLLQDQILKFSPKVVCVPTLSCQSKIQLFLKSHSAHCEILVGDEGLCQLAGMSDIDLLLSGIVGTSAIAPVRAAILQGTPIGLASKEVLVAAGQPIMQLARAHNVPLLPIDSEHAAIKQCLAGIEEDTKQISKLIITASGGPFRCLPLSKFDDITVDAALNHPKWQMGRKISIDSATMMNKGLEVIEAHHLFNIPFSQIEVVIHPQSILHSAVEFVDGTILAQMGLPDMRFPIQYVLSYPQKLPNPWPKMSFSEIANLSFEAPDFEKFRLLSFAYECGALGGTWPVIMNAANEAAVQLFLDQKIGFTQISELVETTTKKAKHVQEPSISDIIAIDGDIKSRLAFDYA